MVVVVRVGVGVGVGGGRTERERETKCSLKFIKLLPTLIPPAPTSAVPDNTV